MIETIGLGLALMCDPAAGTGMTRRGAVEAFVRATATVDVATLDALLYDGATLRSADGSIALPKNILISAARSQEPEAPDEVSLRSWVEVGNRTAVVADYGGGDSQLLVFGFFQNCISEVTVFP